MLAWNRWSVYFNEMFSIECWNGHTAFSDAPPIVQLKAAEA